MTSRLETFHLIVDTVGREHSSDRTASEPQVVTLTVTTSLGVSGQQLAQSVGQRADEVVFEPIHALDQRCVIIVVPDEIEVRVNGLAAGPTSVLSVGDVVDISAGQTVLHVALYQRPYIGPALPEHLARECPVCLTRIEAQSKVLVCVRCGGVLHDGTIADDGAADSDGPRLEADADSLQCARIVTSCPCCSQRLAFTEGYVDAPAL